MSFVRFRPKSVTFSFPFSLLYEKETPTQVLPCEYCEICNNTCYEEHLPTAASDNRYYRNSNAKSYFSVASCKWP